MTHRLSRNETIDMLDAYLGKTKLPKLLKQGSEVYYLAEYDNKVEPSHPLNYSMQQLRNESYGDGIYNIRFIPVWDDDELFMAIALENETAELSANEAEDFVVNSVTYSELDDAEDEDYANETVFKMIFRREESCVGFRTLIDKIHPIHHYSVTYDCIRACILSAEMSSLGTYEVSVKYHDDADLVMRGVKITITRVSNYHRLLDHHPILQKINLIVAHFSVTQATHTFGLFHEFLRKLDSILSPNLIKNESVATDMTEQSILNQVIRDILGKLILDKEEK